MVKIVFQSKRKIFSLTNGVKFQSPKFLIKFSRYNDKADRADLICNGKSSHSINFLMSYFTFEVDCLKCTSEVLWGFFLKIK